MISKFFIDRPIFACVISIIIVLAGIIGLRALPIEEYPQLTPPEVVVFTTYSGADSQTIADTVAAPLENAINGVENMIYMKSTSNSAGTLELNIYFEIGTNPQTASINVNNRVNQVLALLPKEVQRSGVTVTQRNSSFLEVITFYDPQAATNIIELNNYVNINVVDELKRVQGVGSASIPGSKDYAMRIWLKPNLLKKYNITTTEIASAIREQNNQYPTGKIGESPMDGINNPYVYSIKPEGRYNTVKQFENIILRSNQKGSMLKLKDVAKIELGASYYTFTGKINSHEMVPVLISLQNGANAIATADLVQEKLKELSKNFPGSLTYKISYDTTKFVRVSIYEVIETFFEAMALVLLVIYLFLGNFRATIIPMLAIPVSIIGTFAGLYMVGFSINLITLFAMILAIGIVVDDAIIVIENVERVLNEEPQLSVKDATKKAMGEIVAPVISIVLVLCSVFIPVSFMGGFVGIIQKQFAITLVIAVILSGIVALTLTPALCAVMLSKKRSEKWWLVLKFNKFFDWSTTIFSAGVSKILRHIFLSLTTVAIMMFFVVWLFKIIPTGFVPPEDKGSIITTISLPPGSSLKRTIASMDDIYLKIKNNPNVVNFTGLAGYDIMSGGLRENAGLAFIKLKDWDERSKAEDSIFALANRFNKEFWMSRQFTAYFLSPPPISGLSITGGFELYAQNTEGKTYAQIESDMHKLISIASKRPELALVRTTLTTDFPQYNLTINKDKIKMLGINIADIFSTINATLGKYYVNDFNILGHTFKVDLRAEAPYRDSPENIRSLFVRNDKGNLIPLNSVVTLTRSMGPDTVDRFNGFPAAKVMGEPARGYTSGQAINAISEVFKEVFPTGYTIGWSGSSYQEITSTGAGKTAFIFGLVFVFLVLAAQYERWLMPLAVLTIVPFSVFGALVFTYFRGLTNDIYFQVGLLLLIGLGAKNAILMVEFAMEEHKAGNSIFDSAIKAAKMRFRPIIMTSLAFTLGVFPMIIGSGAGAASRHSLGTGVVGGMIAASTIAIFFVPLFFYILENFNDKLSKKDKKQISPEISKVENV